MGSFCFQNPKESLFCVESAQKGLGSEEGKAVPPTLPGTLGGIV